MLTMPTRWTIFFLLLIWEILKSFLHIFLLSCDQCDTSGKYIYLIATGNHHPFGPGREHKLPRVLPSQYDLLHKHPSVGCVIIFVQNLRRHSFNEQSFSNNNKARFPPWINFEDLILWGISNFQSQVGEWGRGSHYPGDEKAAPGEETVGKGRPVLWGGDKNTKSQRWFLFISAWMMLLGARP